MNIDNTEEKVNLIDFLRVFFAVGIVGIHTGLDLSLPRPLGYIILKLWFRLGVPFFFVTSGFFLAKKLEECSPQRRIDVAAGSCRRYIVPLVVFGSIGLLESCIKIGFSTEIIKTIHNAVFYPVGAMWYVAALIVGTIAIALLYEHKFVLGGISIAGYLFALLCNSYYFAVENTRIAAIVNVYMDNFVSARNGLFEGIPLMFCGVVLFRIIRKTGGRRRLPIILTGFAVFLLYSGEIVFCVHKHAIDDASLYILSPVCAAMIFWIGYSISVRVKANTSVLCRKLSKFLYFLHPVFSRGVIGTHIQGAVQSNVIFFVYVSVLCIAVFLICQRNEKCNRFFNKLF